MVLLKGVDKDGFVWSVLLFIIIIIIILFTFTCQFIVMFLMLFAPLFCNFMRLFSIYFVFSYVGIPITKVERLINYLKILGLHFFFTGMLLTVR